MDGLSYHDGAHLKALGILVWILGPESATARVLLRQSWLQCGRLLLYYWQIKKNKPIF